MTNPWVDVRKRDADTDEWLERNWGWADTAGAGPSAHRLAHEDRKRLLADADALLRVVRAVDKLDKDATLGHEEMLFVRNALAAVPEHLK